MSLPGLTMRMPKCVRWSHRQMVLLLVDSLETVQPFPFQPPVPSSGNTEVLHYNLWRSV